MRTAAFLLFLISAVSLSACDASVDPFIETNRYYTLFGTLDMALDTQFVRVIPVRRSLEDVSTEPLSATVTSTDLTTGLTHAWRDSVVQFPGGDAAHIFYAPLRVQSGHTYRIVVANGDSISSAETTLPSRAQPSVLEPSLFGGFHTLGRGSQDIVWNRLRREPHAVGVWYRFLMIFDAGPDGPGFLDISIPESPPREPVQGGWKFTLDLDEHRNVLDTLLVDGIEQFPLVGVGMRITVLDAAFEPPGGVFDRNLQVEPGTFSNVEQGFGFVGSVGRFSVEWVFSNEAAQRLGYVTLDEIYGAGKAAQIRRRLNLHAPGTPAK